MIIVSHFDDTNINHFMTLEIHAIFRVISKLKRQGVRDIRVCLTRTSRDPSAQRWREGFVRALLASPDLLANAVDADSSDSTLVIDRLTWFPRSEDDNGPIVPPFHFEYSPKFETVDMMRSMSEAVVAASLSTSQNPPRITSKKVLVVVRSTSRIAFDLLTRTRLEDYVKSNAPNDVRVETISDSNNPTFEDQVRAFSSADCIVGVHGAALTNVVFARPGATLIEVSFRKHWHCDPVCPAHRSGALAFVEPCGTNVARPYHKADYRNLAIAKGLVYVEVDALDAGSYASDNPISLDSVYVDGDRVIRAIESPISVNER